MSGHTPGPWTAGNSRGQDRYLVFDRLDNAVASAASVGYKEATTYANARLIAAAPTMKSLYEMIEARDWPALIRFAKDHDCLPADHGAGDPAEYEWKGDHHEDARYTFPAQDALINACIRAVLDIATDWEG